MIDVRFIRSPEEIALFRRLAEESARELRMSLAHYFARYPVLFEPDLVMPIRLTVNGVELFSCGGGDHPAIRGNALDVERRHRDGHPPCPWAFLPIVPIGFESIGCLRGHGEPRSRGVCSVRGGDALTLRVEGGRVRLSSSLTGRSAEASFDEVRTAFDAFNSEMSRYLFDEIPELAENVEIGHWVRGGPAFIH